MMVVWFRYFLKVGFAKVSLIFVYFNAGGLELASGEVERVITQSELRNRLSGYWIGQLVGNYLGFPFENLYDEEPLPVDIDRYYDFNDAGKSGLRMNLSDRRAFTPIVADALGGAWSDDDTDIEFVTLHAVEKYGLDLTYSELTAMWKQHVNRFIWGAARNARNLMENGVLPPQTGSRELNDRWFGISSQLMTEIWGAFYPGMLAQAAERAEWNARVMSDDWATHPDIAYCVMYSAAFFVDDEESLVELAIRSLPETSLYRKGIEDVLGWHREIGDWRVARQKMHDRYYSSVGGEKIEYPMGSAFINGLAGIMAILYGEGDFMRTVSIATSIGYDCDNQAATCGGLLGIMNGGDSIPVELTLDLPSRGKWKQPFNNQYINYSRDGLPNYNEIADIVERVLAICEIAILGNGGRKETLDGKVYYFVKTQNLTLNDLQIDAAPARVVFEDRFDEGARGEIAANPVLLRPSEGMGYESNVKEGYSLKRWIVADVEPDGPRRAFWTIPRLEDGVVEYAEQAGRSRNSVAYAGIPAPADATQYVVTFRQRAHDNDSIGFVIGASEPVLEHDGIEISYQRQLPGTDETVPDIYYTSPWGDGIIVGQALLREWVEHRIEVRDGHVVWSQNGNAMLAGSVENLRAGGWFGIRQRYERGTRYDDVRITVLK